MSAAGRKPCPPTAAATSSWASIRCPGAARGFAFVQGIAEYLPFRDGVFDRVLFATSLDHMLSPRRAIAEARRVVRPDGLVCVWHGEPPLPPRWSWRDRLNRRVTGGPTLLVYRTPRGAVDPSHVSHARFATILEWLAEGGLAIDDEHRDEIGNVWSPPSALTDVALMHRSRRA